MIGIRSILRAELHPARALQSFQISILGVLERFDDFTGPMPSGNFLRSQSPHPTGDLKLECVISMIVPFLAITHNRHHIAPGHCLELAGTRYRRSASPSALPTLLSHSGYPALRPPKAAVIICGTGPGFRK